MGRTNNNTRALGKAVMQALEGRLMLAAQLVFDAAPGSFGSNSQLFTPVGSNLFFHAYRPDVGIELFKTNGTAAGTTLVKDVNPTFNENYNIWPYNLTAVGNTLFFAEDDGVHGDGLWKSDGTTAGTVLVKAIAVDEYTKPAAVGSTLFFAAANGTEAPVLWKSDGTVAGTVMVKDIIPSGLLNVNGTLYFATYGGELWKSNGTAAGTTLVKDIAAGDVGLFD